MYNLDRVVQGIELPGFLDLDLFGSGPINFRAGGDFNADVLEPRIRGRPNRRTTPPRAGGR